MNTNPCLQRDCTMLGIIEGVRREDDGSETRGWWCFPHSPLMADVIAAEPVFTPGPTPTVDVPDGFVLAAPPVTSDDDGTPTFHTDVTAGLAAILLEHTAMAMLPGEDPTGDAMASLAANTGLDPDVCAGMILAMSVLVAVSGISGEDLMSLAETYEAVAEAEQLPPDQDLPGEPCAVCDGVGTISVPTGGKRTITEDCDACHGTGRIPDPPDDDDDDQADDVPAWGVDGDGTIHEAPEPAPVEKVSAPAKKARAAKKAAVKKTTANRDKEKQP